MQGSCHVFLACQIILPHKAAKAILGRIGNLLDRSFHDFASFRVHELRVLTSASMLACVHGVPFVHGDVLSYPLPGVTQHFVAGYVRHLDAIPGLCLSSASLLGTAEAVMIWEVWCPEPPM